MSNELVKAMEEFCLRVLKGGENVTPQETKALPNVLIVLERLPDEKPDSRPAD